MMPTLEAVLACLRGPVKVGPVAYKALCPVHQESTPSLSIRLMPDGCVAAHCFGCGAGTRAVLEALQIAQDVPGRAIEAHPEGSPGWLEQVHREALQRAIRQTGRDDPVIDELYSWLERILDLQDAALRLGPDDPTCWDMLEHAASLTHEFRLLDARLWDDAA